MENSGQNFLPLHLAAPSQKLPVSMTLSQKFFYPRASPEEGQSLQQKEKKRRKRKGEKKFKNRKA